jgi:Raf kinase inhibitor-like YbhB/YbcL family protein
MTLVLVACNRTKPQNTAGNMNSNTTGVNTPTPMGGADTTGTSPNNMGNGMSAMAISVTSTAFTDSMTIPKQYTCEGKDMSPPVAWSGIPAGTKSEALILDDPDAPNGTWTHWIIWNIPPSVTSLDEGLAKTATVAGMKQGQNSWPKTGYNGPCPPPGNAHRYYFTVFALDKILDLPDNSNRAALESAMQGHILSQGQLLGMYAKGGGSSATGGTGTKKG